MRIVDLCAVIVALSLASSAGFAQQSRDGYASETSERIARSLRNYHAIFGTDPRATTYALKALCMPLAPTFKTECETKVDEVTKLFRNTETLLDAQPKRVDALPDVYERQYKRGTMANMAITDQINWARFQYAYVAFLTWYVNCYPLPAIDNAPISFPFDAIEKRGAPTQPPGAPPAQAPPLKPPGS
ncbi:MAG TPA: hypothetical protein VNK48_05435 [Xanthobacteraceae bacterium]|nr:hypothetical protein [Xanthobacteraceae bacterium]